MPKWYETNYCNHRDWILDNLELLKLSSQEVMFCLIIDFFNQNNIEATYENLSNKLGIKDTEIDSMICDLSMKKYLTFKFKNGHMQYSLKPLFDKEFMNSENDFQTVFEQFEDAFKRPLSSTEMEKISDFLKEYEIEDVLYALRSADAYQKISIAYIETILMNKKNNG